MKITIAFLLASIAIARCQTNLVFDFTNASGIFITNAEVVKIYPNKIMYHTAIGGGMVAISTLPPDIREKLGFDSNAAAEADAKDAAIHSADRRHQAELIQASQIEAARAKLIRDVVSKRVTFYGDVVQKIDAGLLVDTPGSYDTEMSSIIILVKRYPEENAVAAKDQLHITAIPIGTYTYTTVQKSSNTVHVYTCDPNEAADFYSNPNPIIPADAIAARPKSELDPNTGLPYGLHLDPKTVPDLQSNSVAITPSASK